MRPFLGACTLLALFCTITPAADPTPADAIAVLIKLKATYYPQNSDKIGIIDINKKKVTDADLKVLGVLTTARELRVGAEAKETVKDKKDKKDKTVYKSAITDEGLKNLAGLVELRKLELEGANITNAGLKHLAGMKNLTMLNLTGAKVTDDGMEELTKLPKLETVMLYDTKITDKGVGVLKRWKLEVKVLK
jgi:hypothetical protein